VSRPDPDDEVTVETPTLTDAELMALLPRHPWEGAQERAMKQVVTDLLQPKEETDAQDHEGQ